MTDEFRTTMLCSKCFEPIISSKSPDRYQTCKGCNLQLNRDINGAINIETVGLAQHFPEEFQKPSNFDRKVKMTDKPKRVKKEKRLTLKGRRKHQKTLKKERKQKDFDAFQQKEGRFRYNL